MNQTKVRLWFEIGLAAVCVMLFAVTLIWSQWIELVLQIDPDEGSGSLEWWIMAGAALLALAAILLARADWRRLRSTEGSL